MFRKILLPLQQASNTHSQWCRRITHMQLYIIMAIQKAEDLFKSRNLWQKTEEMATAIAKCDAVLSLSGQSG